MLTVEMLVLSLNYVFGQTIVRIDRIVILRKTGFGRLITNANQPQKWSRNQNSYFWLEIFVLVESSITSC